MHKFVVGVGIITLLATFGIIFSTVKPNTSESTISTSVEFTETPVTPATNIQASFAIFTNGTFRVFTASMYHNLSEDVYIDSSNPNIVYIKKPGTTWNEFFSTLPFKLTSECLTTGTKETFCTGNTGTLKFYINGERNDNALSQEIRKDDKFLVTFGNDSEESIKKQINRIQ